MSNDDDRPTNGSPDPAAGENEVERANEQDPRQDATPGEPWGGEPIEGAVQDQPRHEAPAYGQPPADQSSEGQPHGGRSPSVQPDHGEPGYGQPGHGQPAYGQSDSGQPAYGQPHGGQGSYGPPQGGAHQTQTSYSGPYVPYGGPQGPGQGQGQQGYGGAGYQFTGMRPQDARTWALLTHLAAPALYLLSVGWAGFLAPLVLWLIFKDRDPLVRQAGAGSFNFNFALMLVSIGAWILGLFTLGLLLPLTLLVVAAIFIVQIVFGVLGAMAASRGEAYKYPFEVPILK